MGNNRWCCASTQLSKWAHKTRHHSHPHRKCAMRHTCSLQALASYGLGGHAQHLELLQCSGLVPAIVGHLRTPPPPPTAVAQQTEAQHAIAEAALEAAISLTISQQGLQVCMCVHCMPMQLNISDRLCTKA